MQNDNGKNRRQFFSFWASGIAVVLLLFGATACSSDDASPNPSALSSEGARKNQGLSGQKNSFYLSETDVPCPGAPPGSPACSTTGNNDINYTDSALDNSQITSESGTTHEVANPIHRIDHIVVPHDFMEFVYNWSKKAQCVTRPPEPSPWYDSFDDGRRQRWDAFCAAFIKGGLGAKGIAAMCNVDNICFGRADENTCEYGHCLEASATFACEAVRRSTPLDQIKICETTNDHIFSMIKQPNGKFCILDRWTVPWNTAEPEAKGAVICDVEIINGKVTIGGKSSENKWYNELKCRSIKNHYAIRCDGYPKVVPPPKQLQPSNCPKGTIQWKGECKTCKPEYVFNFEDGKCYKCLPGYVFRPDTKMCVPVKLTSPRRP